MEWAFYTLSLLAFVFLFSVPSLIIFELCCSRFPSRWKFQVFFKENSYFILEKTSVILPTPRLIHGPFKTLSSTKDFLKELLK